MSQTSWSTGRGGSLAAALALRLLQALPRRGTLVIAAVVNAVTAGAFASPAGEPPPLLPATVVQALAAELSGTAAKRTVQELTLFHRMRGSRELRAAAERIRDHAREYGLQQVEILSLPADGVVFYGTQRSRPAWDAEFAELWEQRQLAAARAGEGGWVDAERIGSWQARPVTLAEDSASGEAVADLVDVGEGTSERDYSGKEVRGKLVLAGAQPGPVAALAVDRFGAAGIVSYAQNQVTAWWREDENLVRWGHLATFPAQRTFAFMVSLKQARAWQERLARKEPVRLRASVRAGQHPGNYDVVTAVIPGVGPGGEEIAFSCHLDHERPGANDNASGCATILEAGRALAKLIREGKVAPPRRTLRFVWPPEVEGTLALLNAHPELAARARAVVHMDMVGGDAEITKAVFHVTRSPRSLPTFVNDVGEAFGRFVNAQSDAFAATGAAPYPLVDPEGGKRALQAEVVDFTPGSDHEVWTEGSWRVPAIYLNDWPDRTIHTDADAVGNIDATKLLRAAFIGAASAYYLARLDSGEVPALLDLLRRHALERTAAALARGGWLGAGLEAENLLRRHFAHEAAVVDSISAFAAVPPALRQSAQGFLASLRQSIAATDVLGMVDGNGKTPDRAGMMTDGTGTAADGSGTPPATNGSSAPGMPGGTVVYRRNASPKGPMIAFGYSYLEDQLSRRKLPRPSLLQFKGLWGDGADYSYEALNLVDGKRTVREIRDELATIYGPVPLAQVADYLATLDRIGVLGR